MCGRFTGTISVKNIQEIVFLKCLRWIGESIEVVDCFSNWKKLSHKWKRLIEGKEDYIEKYTLFALIP